MSAIDGIAEVIVFARDMERMVAFYADTLDLEVAAGTPGDGFVRFETGECSFCLHAGAEGAPGRYAPKVVFSVPDAEEARVDLLEQGVEVGEVHSPAPGIETFDAHDPEGNVFSIEAADGGG